MSMRHNLKRLRVIFKFVGFFGFLSIPHILNKLGVNPALFVTWDQIAVEFWQNTAHHLTSLLTTFYIGAVSVIISIILGVSLGMLFAYYDQWIGFFETVMKFIWSIPLIVIAVYLNIFINSSSAYIVIMGVFLGIFPILSFTYHKGIEPNEGILSLVASFNLSKRDEFLHLRLKEIFSNLVMPLKQSVPLAYIGVTMGEYTYGRVAGSDEFGLGSDFQFAMQWSKFEKVYVAMILMVFLVFISGELFEIISLSRSNLNRLGDKFNKTRSGK